MFLAKLSGFRGIHSSFQFSLLKEITPALVAIGRALAGLQLFHSCFCVMPPLDDLDDSGRLVGPDIVADDYVRGVVFVSCQGASVCLRSNPSNCGLTAPLVLS